MLTLFLLVCSVGLIFFVYVLVAGEKSKPRGKPAARVQRVSGDPVIDSAVGRRYFVHLEQEMAHFYAAHRELAWLVALAIGLLAGVDRAQAWQAPTAMQNAASVAAQPPEAPARSQSSAETLENMQQQMSQLEGEVEQLRAQIKQMQSAMSSSRSPVDDPPPPQASHSPADLVANAVLPQQNASAASDTVLSAEDRGVLNYLKTTTINFMIDGYYAWNFNQPVGRVNLLRAYDVSSNAFSLNQAAVVFDHPADLSNGRPFGARLDLQFGQATATLQGNPANEPRPDVYRNVFQAYGSYVAPVAKGWEIDFGKFASSLGIEGNYTKDQINYSRSYWFNFLPFYHMGVRTSLKLNDVIALNYWIVNGTNQTEPTNGYKDELFGFVLTPKKSISWTTNYYVGQEHPDAVAVSTCGPVPVQPGLCFNQISPAPNGKLHIFDSYASWLPTPKLTLQLEGDYVIERLWANAGPGESSAPSHTTGGAAYAQYLFSSKYGLGARAEYLSDRGGLFSGVTEALKEVTVTWDYFATNDFQVRTEWRRDWSNVPIFLTDKQGFYSKDQNTATVGVIWWYGRKQGAW